ncbi:sensor histidine kinase [Verminephrobacter eiseniae]|uniref:sensor histidine kinase n=3 Tax=Verminephrobacter eiseniae TaxID=364317 RepID=UPI002237278D|nr:histidine kinase [Verminephrobacter eiseniae]MCW5230080.1 sensor histidine kinase [Verminephrobacter eiseniae]MCW5291812.1 sensor histidine kinase [Verminephrobacter eiseniae]MCW8185619.1 sensor histidine kinase [Verminephrobacter eiseniae]MCW8224242.1 sensor histidine kinase [Verminephrobacter eiseniae]
MSAALPDRDGAWSRATPIDWLDKLRNLLRTMAFCLVIAAIQCAFQPDWPYDIPLRYSLAIGTLCWALIDFGRHLFRPNPDTGWPAGIPGLVLPALGIILGYLGGNLLAAWWCGFSSWAPGGGAQLRISIGITLLAGFAVIYFFYSDSKHTRLHARMDEARGQAAEAQLRLLQTQLEPHMLFNTLANLRMLIGTDPARAQQMIDRMIDYLRATLSASRSTEHPLATEFERLRDYLELMAMRMGPRMAYTLTLPEALRSVPVPTLLLQPLVENAIRHGLEPQVAGGRISVRAGTRPGAHGPLLVIEVHDTGAGLPPAPPPPGQGFGLSQVRERLASRHGSAGTLDVQTPSAGGTCACVTFPLRPAP